MRKMWQIAYRDLGAFFSTWMGYVIVAASLLITGLLFNAYAVGNDPKLSAEVIADFFYFASGISMVAGVFLAMRLMAEERQVGTLVLLFSSPISERQIIYGKFLSALIFSIILQIVSLYMPALVMVHGKISFGHLAAGYLCLTLLGASTIAITLFASTMAPNQLIAAVGGSFLTVFLLTSWMLAKVVDQPFRDIFEWISIHSEHFIPFSNGLVNLKDIVFYVGLIVFFLECSTRALVGRRCRG